MGCFIESSFLPSDGDVMFCSASDSLLVAQHRSVLSGNLQPGKVRGNPYLDPTSVHPGEGVLQVSVTQMQQVASSNKGYLGKTRQAFPAARAPQEKHMARFSPALLLFPHIPSKPPLGDGGVADHILDCG